MRTFITTFLILFFLSSCQNDILPKGTIQGVVENAQKVPLEGAKVTIFYLDDAGINDINKSVFTAADGKFIFADIKYCTFRIEVSKDGYQPYSKAMALTEKELNNIIKLIP